MLLKTRFYIPPLREKSVFRQALVDKLDHTKGGELMLVSAPAGYGKTTLVSQWLHNNPHTFAWIVLDQSTLTPLLFWEYIINALQSIQPTIGMKANTLLKQVDGIHLESVVVSVLNDLDAFSTLNNPKQPMTLVLDDFHKAEDPVILSSFNLFLDHLPPGIRVVLTARREPFLSLARRRANNQLHELQVDDLVFGAQDSSRFLRETMALSLSDEEIMDLCTKTEGWAVGLQLAALFIQKGGDKKQATLHKASLNRNIADYLFEEVFASQSEELQHFLINTACPTRFCAALSNAITQRTDSLVLLKQLDHLNLFLIPLDNHRTWYRYHDLFRHFLLQRFEQMNTQMQIDIRQRVADWLEHAGYLDDAIDQLCLIKNWSCAQRLLEQVAPAMIKQGYQEKLQQWLKNLPLEVQTQLSFCDALLRNANDEPSAPLEDDSQAVIDNNSTQIEPLTQREAEVMHWVTKGLNNKQIADKLSISINTLKVHIRNLYGKIGVENRTQAILKAGDKTNTER